VFFFGTLITLIRRICTDKNKYISDHLLNLRHLCSSFFFISIFLARAKAYPSIFAGERSSLLYQENDHPERLL
jgi:hypothetical protein